MGNTSRLNTRLMSMSFASPKQAHGLCAMISVNKLVGVWTLGLSWGIEPWLNGIVLDMAIFIAYFTPNRH